jgi:hypothetical protein
MWQAVSDFRHASLRADFILVSAGGTSHAQGAHDGILGLERHSAWQRHDIAHRCEPRREGIALGQIENFPDVSKPKIGPNVTTA